MNPEIPELRPPPLQQPSQQEQSSPNRSVTVLKAQFFGMLRDNESPQKIQQLLIDKRKLFNEKVVLHLYVAEPKLYQQFRYLMLALALTFDRKEEYSLKWSTFYEIINQILKIPDAVRLSTKLDSNVVEFTLFLIDHITVFFKQFPSTLALLKEPAYANVYAIKNDEQNVLLVKRIVRIFNSLLCLKFVSVDDFINLIFCFGVKARNYVEFLTSIEDKFVKRLIEFELQAKKQKQQQSVQSSTQPQVLSLPQIYHLLHIFYDLDPEVKLIPLIKSQLPASYCPPSPLSFSAIPHKKQSKEAVRYDKLLKFILKEIIKHKSMNPKTKKQCILECFNQVQEIDEDMFDSLLEVQANQSDHDVSDIIIKAVERESLRFITVSRLKSILKRFNISKAISYNANIQKMFRILRLLYWLAKKFNESLPAFMMDVTSTISIQNISKATMLLFAVDFNSPQAGRVAQFQLNKVTFDLIIKYSESEENCTIDIILQANGKQTIKQKKQVTKWSYILCMVGLIEKKVLGIFIDGALFKVQLEDSASEISQVEFGPFLGTIKDVYVLDKLYDMNQLYKRYFQKFRKIDSLLQQLGEKSFIFAFQRGKVAEQSKWFWKKQMAVQYTNVKKLRSISFSEGIEQLGGFPALLFLIARVVNTQKSDELVNFLIDFFEFLKLLINQSQISQAQKWLKDSTVYFGQFFWLLLSKNQHLRSQKVLFNRIFDFFGWFFKNGTNELSISLRLAIIGDIYLNFQIWSKCSTPIKLMLFQQIGSKIEQKQSIILMEMFNRKDYQKILSSIIFFFAQQNPDEDEQSNQISGVKISPVHEQIAKISSKFCQLYGHEKLQYNAEIIRKDVILVMAMISTFFQKDHLYFSQSQLSALAALLSHFTTNFTIPQILQKTMDYQIFIFDQLTHLISLCPAQCELIFLLFELCFFLLAELENIKNGAAMIIDKLTMQNKRADDSLQFSYKQIIYIIKQSKILFEPSSVINQQQILSTLIGSIRNKVANSKLDKPIKKLTYRQVTKQFEKFPFVKMYILLSLNQFCMMIQECVETQDIFPTAAFFLKVIIKNQMLPQVSSLAINCIKIVNEFILKDLKRMNRINQMSLGELEKKRRKSAQNQQEMMVGEKNKQFQSQQILYEYSLIKLREMMQNFSIQSFFKYCRCPQLLEVLISLGCLVWPQTKLCLPFSQINWEKSVSGLGGNLALVLKMQNISQIELEILLSFLTSKRTIVHPSIQLEQEKLMSETTQPTSKEGEDILQMLIPLLIIQNCINLISAGSTIQPRKSYAQTSGSSSELSAVMVTAYEHIDLKVILGYNTAIKNCKNMIYAIAKSDEEGYSKDLSSGRNKKVQLLNLNNKIIDQYSKNKDSSTPLQNELMEIKQKIMKGNQEAQPLFQNTKYVKKINGDIKQVINNFINFVKLYAKNVEVCNSVRIQPFNNQIKRRKTIDSSKKKKMLEITDPKQRFLYKQDLKITLKDICTKLQKESKKKQETWQSLHEKNKFWVSSKIKNNECYQIHPKMTGFYRLNIVKSKFEEVPYPRRKSFEHELQSTNQEESEIQSKQQGLEFMKNIIEESEQIRQNMERTTSSELLSNSRNIQSNSKVPKDHFYAEYVTQRGVYAGIFYYSAGDLSFIFKCKGYDFLPKEKVYQFSTIFHRIDDLDLKLVIPVIAKTEIFARRYIHRHTAIEIFSHQKSYFFNLFERQAKDKFFKNFSSKITCIIDPRAEFEKRKFTDKWMNGDYDNFEYLMLVNLYSGRTVNDLAQYPVMPWVITNFDEQECQLNKQFLRDQKNVRDLSKPSGMLDEKKFQNLKMRCNQIEEEDYQSKFLYGTMYSNPTVIYNFFIRLEPFTTLHWEHQGRRIDHADRLFSAVRDQFNTVKTSTSDNKELVPEFYYWPQFLKNRNKVNLGIKQNKEEVHDVKLPGWARNPQQFIFKMREVLQSPDVTRKINQWIDLIFGYKNPYDVALQYNNLFHYRSYEHDIFQTQQSDQALKGAQISISQYGQVPMPIFLKEHPERNLVFSENFKLDSSILIKKHGNRKICNIELTVQGFFIGYQNQVQFYSQDSLKIVESTLDKPTYSYPSTGSIQRLLDFTTNLWFSLKDGIFYIYDKKKKVVEMDCEMECFSNFGKYIIYGFRSELIVMRIEQNYRLWKINSFYGHKSNIYKIETSTFLDLIVSIDSGGLVLVHEFSKQKLMRQFQLGSKVQVIDLCIHEMGYFIFFTKDQKLIIYTFLGQLYFSQDIGINNKATMEQITKVAIFQQNRSHLFLATDKGKIYLADFLQIKRFNENCVYKEFSRFKNNILENCHSKLGTVLAIKDFIVKKVPGKGVLTYKFYVLFHNNEIQCYYSSQQFQDKIKKNKMLGQLGLFDTPN